MDSVLTAGTTVNGTTGDTTVQPYPNRGMQPGNQCSGLSAGWTPYTYGVTDAARAYAQANTSLGNSGSAIGVVGGGDGPGPCTLANYTITTGTCPSGPNAGPGKQYYLLTGAQFSGFKVGIPVRGSAVSTSPPIPGRKIVPQPAMMDRLAKPMVPAALAFMVKRTAVPLAIAAIPEAVKLLGKMLDRYRPTPNTRSSGPPAGAYMIMLSSEPEVVDSTANTTPPKASPINIIYEDNSVVINSSINIMNFDYDTGDMDTGLDEPSKDWMSTLAGALGGLISMLGGELLDSIAAGIAELASSGFSAAANAAGKAIAEVLESVLADLIDRGIPGDDTYAEPPEFDFDALQTAIALGVSEALTTLPESSTNVSFSPEAVDVLDSYFKVDGTDASLATVLTFPFVIPDPYTSPT